VLDFLLLADEYQRRVKERTDNDIVPWLKE